MCYAAYRGEQATRGEAAPAVSDSLHAQLTAPPLRKVAAAHWTQRPYALPAALELSGLDASRGDGG